MSISTADLSDAHPDAQVAAPGLRDFGGVLAFSGPVQTVHAPEDNSLVRVWIVEQIQRGMAVALRQRLGEGQGRLDRFLYFFLSSKDSAVRGERMLPFLRVHDLGGWALFGTFFLLLGRSRWLDLGLHGSRLISICLCREEPVQDSDFCFTDLWLFP